MREAYEIVDHSYDVVIVGAGGAGGMETLCCRGGALIGATVARACGGEASATTCPLVPPIN